MHDLYVFSIPLIAFILDQLLADPYDLPHPVVFIGKAIDRLEALCRRFDETRFSFLGGIAACLLCIIVALSSWTLISIPFVGIFIAIYLAFAGLALKGLVREAGKVERHLATDDISGARTALAMLVSRDTSTMDEHEIRRSLAETVSENYSDGFFAPFFYLVVAGPVGLWVYKTINTFDSMWGYRTERYEQLGWFAAKADDMANLIPARLSVFSLFLAGKGLGLETAKVLKKTKEQAPAMESPNAGWPMAACAWLLQASMGGSTVYFDRVKEKPILGPRGQTWTSEKIATLFALVNRAGWITMLLSMPVLYLFS